MINIQSIVKLIEDGVATTGDVVHVASNGELKVSRSFSLSDDVLNVHIGFNVLDDSDIPALVSKSVNESVEIHNKYFPQAI